MAKHFRCFMLLNCCLKCFILLTLNGSPRSRVPAMFSSAFWKWQHSFSPNVRQGVCANVLLQCVLRYRGRWGQPLHLSSTLNYNTTYNYPPELSSGVPPPFWAQQWRASTRQRTAAGSETVCNLGRGRRQKAKCSHTWAAGGDCSILSSMLPHHCTPKY